MNKHGNVRAKKLLSSQDRRFTIFHSFDLRYSAPYVDDAHQWLLRIISSLQNDFELLQPPRNLVRHAPTALSAAEKWAIDFAFKQHDSHAMKEKCIRYTTSCLFVLFCFRH